MKVLKSTINETIERWMQWLVLYTYMNFLLTGCIAGWLVWLLLLIYVPLLRYPLLLYIAWIIYDRKSGELGERRSEWVRSLRYWKYHNDFFPAKVHKTAELSRDKNYLLCVFPHGVLSTGPFCAFGNSYGNFSRLFPGLKSYMITLGQHFITPFIREFSMTIGGLPSSARCLNYFLGSKKGVALALVVGGAQEAFYNKPGLYRVYLKKRKGFVKIALKNGSPLVPVISFGEPDIYDQVQFPEESLVRKFQMFVKNLTGIAPILFYGQFSVVPYRKPLNIVVGKPIEFDKIEEPTQEEIDSMHATFTEALISLFESEKHKYVENAENTHLEILVFKNLKPNAPLLRTKKLPVKLPRRQWLETFALLLWMTCGPTVWAFSLLLFYLSPTARYVLLAYLIWVYIDKDSCERGGRRRKWFRQSKWFQLMRDYFPVQLVKTADLPPDQNYLFALFPHGIISMSALITFGTDALNFEQTFKGIKTHLCTLKVNFRLPFIREVALACGAVAASRKSLNWILSHPEKGNSAVLVVGGAAESIFTEPGTYKICLKNRKGFCKVALHNGSPLVPVFSFGEIEILRQVKPENHPWLGKFQLWFKNTTGIAPIIFFGKGIFGDYIGLMPRKYPLTVVVGKPIPVKKVEKPSEEEVDALHKKFMESIIELFNQHKHKYLKEPDTDLVIA